MSHIPGLRFLRPYLSGPLPDSTTVYARFYSASRPRRPFPPAAICMGQQRRALLKAVVSKMANRDARHVREEEELENPANRAVSVDRRIKKLEKFGVLHYPRLESRINRMSISVFVEKFGGDFSSTPLTAEELNQDVTLEGRIMAIRRSSSRLIFLVVRAGYTETQIMINAAQLGSFGGGQQDVFTFAMHPLRRGDIITVQGSPRRNKSNQLVLLAKELPEIIAPALATLPDHLVNEETQILNRHVDMLVTTRTLAIFRLRSLVIKSMRDFFHEQDFIEVQTPILADSAGGAIARPFLTSATAFPEKELAMRIAPELWLKRLVVGGNDRVFEIGPSFRNEGLDTTHNPEFTTCEFYSAYTNLEGLISMTENLVSRLFKDVDAMSQTKLPSMESKVAIPEGRWNRVEFVPALEEKLGFKFPDLSKSDALEKLSSLLAEKHWDEVTPGITLNKLLDNLASKFLEEASMEAPLFIIHHPACMSPLSKSFECPKTGQLVSARAELFMEGREIANMYEEENDPFEQRRKFEEQMQAKSAEDDEGPFEIDESYVQALQHGLPPTGGWGCGVDRLVMLLSGSSRISDTLSFGSLKNVVSLSKAGKA
ncbi:lysyl-tRNA synthetase [Xylariaceae sp. FL0255]|nr:lysyl-tRNA synthetase [Xylariaceae sp. FL0255]